MPLMHITTHIRTPYPSSIFGIQSTGMRQMGAPLTYSTTALTQPLANVLHGQTPSVRSLKWWSVALRARNFNLDRRRESLPLRLVNRTCPGPRSWASPGCLAYRGDSSDRILSRSCPSPASKSIIELTYAVIYSVLGRFEGLGTHQTDGFRVRVLSKNVELPRATLLWSTE